MRKTGCVMLLLLLTAVVSASADEVAVTVYNSNVGVVSETRSLQFEKGTNTLAFKDVPSMIDASSVRFDLLSGDNSVAILEQNYAFDLVGAQAMYRKYVDKDIELIDKGGTVYSGTLLAYDGGTVTLLDQSGRVIIVQMENIAEVKFPALPEGLITRPTLFWLYNSQVEGKLDGRVSYQTAGLNWTAEYVGVLDNSEKQLDLSGWASIDNRSGKTYDNAKLKLVAGDIGRAEPQYPPRLLKAAMEFDGYGAGFEEKAFFEYHLYTLPRKTTLADNEIKQISLFDPASTGVKKIYLYQPEKNATKVQVAVKFTNAKTAGLGMPLPAGRVRMFKADDDGSMILLGEDYIEHTPKDEDVKIMVGYAFDIAAEHRIVSQARISSQVEEQRFEIELRNHKDEPVTVTVEKKLFGYWEVTESDAQYNKKDVNTLLFDVALNANETRVVSFTVRFSSR